MYYCLYSRILILLVTIFTSCIRFLNIVWQHPICSTAKLMNDYVRLLLPQTMAINLTGWQSTHPQMDKKRELFCCWTTANWHICNNKDVLYAQDKFIYSLRYTLEPTFPRHTCYLLLTKPNKQCLCFSCAHVLNNTFLNYKFQKDNWQSLFLSNFKSVLKMFWK